MTEFRVHLDSSAIAHLGDDNSVRALAQEAGDEVAATAAQMAPKRSGEGARSIYAELGHDTQGWFADVAWDLDHFYMIFHEFGTSELAEHPFIRPAIDRYLHL